jgi:hypothetical protein
MSASAVLKLQKVGFTSEQVEALADFMDTQAASKADLEAAVHRLDTKIDGVEHRLDAKIDSVEHRLDLKITALQSDLRLLEQRMTIKLGGMMIIAVGIILAAFRYLPPHP